MARQVLGIIGVEVSAAGVAEHYGSRRPGGNKDDGILDGWLVDSVDAPSVDRIEKAGIPTRAVPLMMTDHDATADMAQAAIDLVLPRR
jgi:LPPG:FO 2-phospho-L-lactate transferase